MFVVVVAHFTDEEIEQGEGRAQSSKPSSMVLMRRGMVGRMWGGGFQDGGYTCIPVPD